MALRAFCRKLNVGANELLANQIAYFINLFYFKPIRMQSGRSALFFITGVPPNLTINKK